MYSTPLLESVKCGRMCPPVGKRNLRDRSATGRSDLAWVASKEGWEPKGT